MRSTPRLLDRFARWALFGVLALVGLPLTAQEVSGPPFLLQDSRSSANVSLRRMAKIAVTSGQTGTLPVFFSIGGGAWQVRYLTRNAAPVDFHQYTGAPVSGWTGLTSTSGDRTFMPGATSPLQVYFSWLNDGTPDGSFTIELPSLEAKVTYTSSNQSLDTLVLPPVSFTIAEGGSTVTKDDPTYLEPKKGDVLLLLNNTTGQPQTVMIQGQPVELMPGMNTVRYQGPVDAITGFPTEGGLPNIPYIGITGPDGVKYAMADYKVNFGSEIGDYYMWTGGNTSATVTGQSSTGAMLTLPGAPGQPTTLIGLPPVSPQPMNNTSTTTPTISNPNTPPPTSPPASQSNPSSVAGAGSGSGSTSGGAPVAAAGSAGEGGFYNAPGSGDPVSEGASMFNEMKGTLASEGNEIKGKTWKWWNIGDQSLGQDMSWTEVQFQWGSTTRRFADFDTSWLAWIRAMLLVMVKVGFVYSVVKLFMK